MTLLSICIPTHERPELLLRALDSVLRSAHHPWACTVELLVSDNSDDDASEQLVRPLLRTWPGPSTYHRNRPSVGMVGNFNRCIELSTGRWLLILHDDDYLLDRGFERLLKGVNRATETDRALLFGVRVVNNRGRLIRLQATPVSRVLDQRKALRRLLTWSSLVRFPAIVVHRDAYATVGTFSEDAGPATDLDMWARLFARYGVRLVPEVAAAYVVHEGAATEMAFTQDYVKLLLPVFDRTAEEGLLSPEEVRRCQAAWFHQFVLAGAFRRLKSGDRAGAREVLGLFDSSALRGLGPSARWMPLRAAFGAVSRMPARTR